MARLSKAPALLLISICAATYPAFGFADECEKVRAATVSGQRDFVAHIIGEDPRHSERVDGEAMYHIARSPMPDLLHCDVVAYGPMPFLICVPAENNLIPSIARRRVTLAAGRIGRCVREPVIGPLKSPSLPGHLQWYVTDWREYRPIRYRLDWSASLKDPAWTLEAGPTIETTSDIGRATRALKSKDKTPDGRPCRQLLAAVDSAQRDFRNTIGAVAETGSDLVLFNSSLPLMDFSVKVGIGGNTPNMLFAERTVPSPNLTRRQAEEMGGAASRALSACLQVRAERIADKSYDDGSVELVWRLADHYPPRPVSVFAVVRFEAGHELVSRTAIRIQRKE